MVTRLTGVAVAFLFAVRPAAAADPLEEARDAFAAGELDRAEEKLAAFRKDSGSGSRYWEASVLWARCTPEAGEAAKRLEAVSRSAPDGVKGTCAIELAHLAVLGDRFAKAAKLFEAMVRDHPRHPRADEARYWRAVCLKETGKLDDALALADALRLDGLDPSWRGVAGLLLGSIREQRAERADAHKTYVELTKASWGADVRPQAFLGAIRTTENAWKRKTLMRDLEGGYPASPETRKARALIRKAGGGGPRFGVQVGAFQRTEGARAELAKFEKAGYRTEIVVREQLGLKLHAVIVGPYDSRGAAGRTKAELASRGFKGFVVSY